MENRMRTMIQARWRLPWAFFLPTGSECLSILRQALRQLYTNFFVEFLTLAEVPLSLHSLDSIYMVRLYMWFLYGPDEHWFQSLRAMSQHENRTPQACKKAKLVVKLYKRTNLLHEYLCIIIEFKKKTRLYITEIKLVFFISLKSFISSREISPCRLVTFSVAVTQRPFMVTFSVAVTQRPFM